MTSKEEAFSSLAPLQNCEKWRLATSCLSVYLLIHPSGWNNSVLTGRGSFLKKIYLSIFSEICRENASLVQTLQNKGYYTWRPMYIYDSMYVNYSQNEKWFWKNVADKLETHTLWSVPFFSEKRAVYEIMWKNMVATDRLKMTIKANMRMRFACCITESTDTHSQYERLIAFPRKQQLRERVSMLRYMYVACLIMNFWSGTSDNDA